MRILHLPSSQHSDTDRERVQPNGEDGGVDNQRQGEEYVVHAVNRGEEEYPLSYPLFRGQFRPRATHQTLVKSGV